MVRYRRLLPTFRLHFRQSRRGDRTRLRLVNSDFSLLRNFTVSERAKVQLRGEFFNAFNHTNFNPPNVVFGSSSFGIVSSAKAARQIQVGVRLVF